MNKIGKMAIHPFDVDSMEDLSRNEIFSNVIKDNYPSLVVRNDCESTEVQPGLAQPLTTILHQY